MTIIGNNIIITLTDTTSKCPKCNISHNISDKILSRGENTKRGYTTIKCGCGTKLAVFDDFIRHKIILEEYMTNKQMKKHYENLI